MGVEVVTLGCRLNAYESEVMRDHATAANLDDTIIVNTCAVTGEAERQARQTIRKLRKENPDAKLIVTGCAAQIHPESFAAMEEVSVVLGNDEKMKAGSYTSLAGNDFGIGDDERVRVNDIMEVTETASHMVGAFAEHTRAFVQVQNGCDHRCTFCIIPFGRGNSRSVPAGEVVSQVRTLVEQGYHEVVLTGVDISSYGEDLPATPRLGDLVKRILTLVPELPRLRISSIDAVEVDDTLFRAIAEEERLMPHLHISIQAGDDMVLKRMKRRHLRHDILEFCAKVREARPDMVFGADMIAGFPTETDAMFENSRRLVEEADLIYLHVFPYSAREGTPAARMPQVPGDVRKARAALLRKAGDAQLFRFLQSKVGTQAEVLVEKKGMGHCTQFAPIYVGGEPEEGSLLTVKIDALQGTVLQSTAV